MIGTIITDPKTGEPLDNKGNKLAESSYQPSEEVKKLFAKVQTDYQIAYSLQHRSFREFDGYSLLDRTRLDQETFGAYVGCEWLPNQKRWRWKGRKNTARNKLIFILSRALAGMLYPTVHAQNEDNEEDKMSARVMRILIEEHLRKAKYEMNFLFLALSALVNPAVFCEVEYIEKMQTVKQRLANGSVKILEVVDELLSGLALSSVPIDEILLPDFYSGTGNIQGLPNILRVRRIPYDTARAIYAGQYFDASGKDLFDYVQAGKTRVVLTGQENQTLYDIDWTEADLNYVQVIVAKYRPEDLELTWVGGVGIFNQEDPYNTNPFEHRRMTLFKDQWVSIPVYNVVMGGFEPLDPTGRFAYYKSGAFKEYWDDMALNTMHRLALDGTFLDVIKPVFISGVKNVTSMVIAPGATVGIPAGQNVTPFSMGPNLKAAYDAIAKQAEDMSDSTNADPVPSTPTPGVPATQTAAAVTQAKVFFGVFSLMIAQLVEGIGALAMDCEVQYTTVGDLDNTVPGVLGMKYKTFLAKGKDKGKNITNKIVFTDRHMGKKYTKAQKDAYEWGLFDKTGGKDSDQRIYEINPYQFARTIYTMFVDADQIVSKSMGAEKAEKQIAFNMMTDPRVAPFTDPEAVANDFVIEEYGGTDPDKYKKKGPPTDMMNAIMGGQGATPGGPVIPARPGAQVSPPGQAGVLA